MNSASDHHSLRLPVELERRVDHVCRQFESAWRLGHRPLIEEYLGTAQGALRTTLLHELLGLELELRQADGERPTVWQYKARFPQQAPLIQHVFSESGASRGSSLPPVSTGFRPVGSRRPDPPPYSAGRYLIQKSLGEDWNSQFFQAQDLHLVCDVTLRIFHQRWLAPAELEKFQRQGRLLRRIENPGLVPVFDAGLDDAGRRYVASRGVGGPTLIQRMASDPPELGVRVQWLAEIAEAVHYLHQQALLHGDLRPGNILLVDDQRPAITNFGVALTVEELQRMEPDPTDRWFLCPEQVAGEDHRHDERGDVFSLGVLLYWLLTDRTPWSGLARGELAAAFFQRQAAPLTPDVPPRLARICRRAMAWRATKRYPTPGHLADALREWLIESSPPAAGPTAVPAPVSPQTAAGPLQALVGPARIADSDVLAEEAGEWLDEPPLSGIPPGLEPLDERHAAGWQACMRSWEWPEELAADVACWKARIESPRSSQAFAVGVLHGPRGAGKTSLLRAGLIPQLGDPVHAVYVSLDGRNASASVREALRRHWPAVADDQPLPQILAAVRRREVAPEPRKILLVIDHIDHCLEAGEDHWGPLADALRQCDGMRLSCLLAVRDAGWSRINACLERMEVQLDEQRNCGAIHPPTRHQALRYLVGLARRDRPLDPGAARSLDPGAALSPATPVLAPVSRQPFEAMELAVRLASSGGQLNWFRLAWLARWLNEEGGRRPDRWPEPGADTSRLPSEAELEAAYFDAVLSRLGTAIASRPVDHRRDQFAPLRVGPLRVGPLRVGPLRDTPPRVGTQGWANLPAWLAQVLERPPISRLTGVLARRLPFQSAVRRRAERACLAVLARLSDSSLEGSSAPWVRRSELRQLPGLTPELADGVLDYLAQGTCLLNRDQCVRDAEAARTPGAGRDATWDEVDERVQLGHPNLAAALNRWLANFPQ